MELHPAKRTKIEIPITNKFTFLNINTPIIYEIEIEEEFDPKHLVPEIVSVAETVELVVGFKYNNVDLTPFRDYGDYWSKGLSFYLY